MCNSSLIHFGTAALTAVVLSSCALPKGGLFSLKSQPNEVKTSPPLQSGVRYEVRKALATTVPFRPKEVKGYTFVLDTPKPAFEKPPLMLASASRLGPSMRVRTTAYTHSESDHIVYGVKNAIGTNLKYGMVRSAAADWSRFPVGTRFSIASEPGIVYEVDDYGSALVGTGTIDLYKPTRGALNAWGTRTVNIEILNWGDDHGALAVLSKRSKYAHVQRMMKDLEKHVASNRNTPPPVTIAASAEVPGPALETSAPDAGGLRVRNDRGARN